MITGDNSQTAFAIAKECGIIDHDMPKSDMNKCVTTGEEFNRNTGGTREIYEGLEG